MTTNPERLSRLEGAYEQVDQRLGDLTGSVESLRGEMNTRLDAMDRRLDAMDSKFDGKFDSLRRDIDNKVNTLTIVIATVSTALAGLMIGLDLWGG